MNAAALLRVLEAVAHGETTAEAALERLSWLPIEEVGGASRRDGERSGEGASPPSGEPDGGGAMRPLGEQASGSRSRTPAAATPFARLDHHRQLRLGYPEVVFCEGKTTGQVVEICERLAARGAGFLATRADEAARLALAERFPRATVNAMGRVVHLRGDQAPQQTTCVAAIVSAGTADLPVAEEAAATAVALGLEARRVYDVGVAGLHRLLREAEAIREADVIVVVAGMEGALPSVVGGLIGAPIVAVPTSVGYGAAFGGLAALLGMLNSCAAGVTVVNIDNGFGAACAAARIGRLLERRT